MRICSLVRIHHFTLLKTFNDDMVHFGRRRYLASRQLRAKYLTCENSLNRRRTKTFSNHLCLFPTLLRKRVRRRTRQWIDIYLSLRMSNKIERGFHSRGSPQLTSTAIKRPLLESHLTRALGRATTQTPDHGAPALRVGCLCF